MRGFGAKSAQNNIPQSPHRCQPKHRLPHLHTNPHHQNSSGPPTSTSYTINLHHQPTQSTSLLCDISCVARSHQPHTPHTSSTHQWPPPCYHPYKPPQPNLHPDLHTPSYRNIKSQSYALRRLLTHSHTRIRAKRHHRNFFHSSGGLLSHHPLSTVRLERARKQVSN